MLRKICNIDACVSMKRKKIEKKTEIWWGKISDRLPLFAQLYHIVKMLNKIKF